MKRQTVGFTLAELLIALALLGMLATFAIPKVLQGLENQQKKATMKETIGAISVVFHEGWQSGQLYEGMPTTVYRQWWFDRLGSVKNCVNATTEGCWPGSDDANNTASAAAVVLANGAFILDLESPVAGVGRDGLYVDWNGMAGPNVVGQDQLQVTVSLITNQQQKPGTASCMPNPASTSANTVLCRQIFE